MNFKPILELLEREHVPGANTTEAFLHEAVADFSVNSVSAMSAIRRLQANDVLGVAVAALRLLVSNEDSTNQRSRGLNYVASLVTSGDLWPQLLLDDRALSSHAATPLARKAVSIHPLLDIGLVRVVLTKTGSSGRVAKSASVIRALTLVEAISDGSRLAPYLIQFLRHPCGRVRSKAALLLGRANRNLARVETLLASPDSRLRANTVESLWGDGRSEVLKHLRKASHDESGRVVVNALLGLCKAGDREGHSRLLKMAENADPALRCGTAWAMGESYDLEFSQALEKLAHDPDVKVQAMAEKSLAKLSAPHPVVPPVLQPVATLVETDPVEKDPPEKPSNHVAYVRIN